MTTYPLSDRLATALLDSGVITTVPTSDDDGRAAEELRSFLAEHRRLQFETEQLTAQVEESKTERAKLLVDAALRDQRIEASEAGGWLTILKRDPDAAALMGALPIRRRTQ